MSFELSDIFYQCPGGGWFRKRLFVAALCAEERMRRKLFCYVARNDCHYDSVDDCGFKLQNVDLK